MNEPLSGNRTVNDWLKAKTGPKLEVVEPHPPGQTDPADASDRCGMESLHAMQGVVLVETSTGDEIGVFYSSILKPITFRATQGITFRYQDDEEVRDVEIIGDGSHESNEKLRLIARQLTWSKRAMICSNGSTVREIRIETAVEEKE